MNKTQNNGRKEAKNALEQKMADVQSSAKAAFYRSLYSQAIVKYLGCEELNSGDTEFRDGVEYKTEFFDFESQDVIIVLEGFDKKTYRSYLNDSWTPGLIFDGEYIPCKLKMRGSERRDILMVGKKVAKHIYNNPRVNIFYEGGLWEHFTHADGKWFWKLMEPSKWYTEMQRLHKEMEANRPLEAAID